MKVANKPLTDSAAVTARVISRRLRAAGLKMSVPFGKDRRSSGVSVCRLGDSRRVEISYHYHVELWGSLMTYEKALAVDQLEKARQVLSDFGYEFDPKYQRMVVTCRFS